jgi:hypothetical protein
MGKLTDVVEHMARVPVRMTAAYIPQLDAERPLKETVATTLIIFFLFFSPEPECEKRAKITRTCKLYKYVYFNTKKCFFIDYQ